MKNKKIIKIILMAVTILLILFLLWTYVFYPAQTFRRNERILSEAGKRYFEINMRNLAKDEGRVSTVSLAVLIRQKYLDELKIKKETCNLNNSNVKMRIENGSPSYYTHLQCGKRHSNVDYQGPVITLNGTKNMTVNKDETYKEPGVLSVKDNTDGSLKASDVTIEGKVDTSKVGTYKVIYKMTDSLDNETVVTRKVDVIQNLSKIVKEETSTTNNYYKGTNNDNYIILNNILFRIVKINSDDTVTIVSHNSLANIDYGANNGRFAGSSMDEWLNKYFYPQLNNKTKKLIVSTKWCDDVFTENKMNCDRYSDERKVGLLSLEDYVNSLDSKGFSYLSMTARSWYNNFDNSKKVWSLKSISMDSYEGNVLLNIKPALTIRKNAKITGGNGTEDDPYRLGTEQEIKRNMKVNKLDIGTQINYAGYEFIVAGHEDDGTTKVIMKDTLVDDSGNLIEISYDNVSPIKIYNPKETGNIAYQINNQLLKYIDTSYFVKKKIDVPVYTKLVTYKGKHSTNSYTLKVSIPSAFELFSGSYNEAAIAYWLIDASKEEENKIMVDRDGTTAFYYKQVGRKAGVKIKAYLDKNVYIESENCNLEECKIAK